jgi:polyisoprenoid-binding protein YceI
MSRRLKLLACAIVLVIALAGAGLWWFLRDDAPAAVDLDAAVESVQPADGATTTASADGVESVDGTWTVDTETGDFDYESATGTFAGFRVDEELSSIGSTTAVGRTGDVSGGIEIDGTTLTAATFEVDLTTITTNESRRDDKVQEALDTGEYPTATFTLTEPVDLGDAAATGDTVDVTATGDLTIHGVTRQVEIPLQARLVDDTVVVVGSLDLTFSDYDVEVPDSPVVLSVDDHGTLELQLLLTRS